MWRRFLLLIALSFSFGGFSFYAIVVVPIGGRVLDATSQGFVTRDVTQVLNVASMVTVLMVAWEAVAGRHDRSPRTNRGLLAAIPLWGLTCLVLAGLHPRLDSFLDPNEFTVTEPLRFYRLHQVYLWTSTLQWLVSLAVIWMLVSGWRSKKECRVPDASGVELIAGLGKLGE